MASVAGRAHIYRMTLLVLIDPPGPFDTLATWQRHLAECRRLPADTMLKAELIETAEAHIREARDSRRPRLPARPT